MTHKGCSKTKSGKHRKHTDIKSEDQRKWFGARLSDIEAGKKPRKGLSRKIIKAHLTESAGKKMPKKVRKKT